MKNYICRFTGRREGAIGSIYAIETRIQCASLEGVREQLYNYGWDVHHSLVVVGVERTDSPWPTDEELAPTLAERALASQQVAPALEAYVSGCKVLPLSDVDFRDLETFQAALRILRKHEMAK